MVFTIGKVVKKDVIVNNLIIHRGPDDNGIFLENNVSIQMLLVEVLVMKIVLKAVLLFAA